MDRKQIQDSIGFPVVEIFHSIQGEGFFTGRSATFVRLSGCNLKCPWCDTDHSAKMGDMTITEILKEMKKVNPNPHLVVITGGEPTIHKMLQHLFIGIKTGFEKAPDISIETNGTNPLMLFRLRNAGLVDLITISPKDNMLDENIVDSLSMADEVKIVMSDVANPSVYEPMLGRYFNRNTAFIQPCSENFAPAVEYVRNHPKWRLSVQIQKIIKVL